MVDWGGKNEARFHLMELRMHEETLIKYLINLTTDVHKLSFK